MILMGETKKLEPLKRGQKQRSSYALRSTTAASVLNYCMNLPASGWNRCVSVVSEYGRVLCWILGLYTIFR
jgi:hypothetical protein